MPSVEIPSLVQNVDRYRKRNRFGLDYCTIY